MRLLFALLLAVSVVVTSCFPTSLTPDPIEVDDVAVSRVYLRRDGPIDDVLSSVNPPYSAANWDRFTDSCGTRDETGLKGGWKLRTTKLVPDNPYGIEAFPTDFGDPANQKVLLLQYVSNPMQAQTISGTVKGQMLFVQDDVQCAFDQTLLRIYVISNDGSVVRGTLLAIGSYGTTNLFATPPAQNRFLANGDALTTLAVLDDDRLVIEIGCRATTPPQVTGFVGCYVGGPATDLPEDETSINEYAPWVEFSNEILFQVPTANLGGYTSYDLGFTDADVGANVLPEVEAAMRRGDYRHLR